MALNVSLVSAEAEIWSGQASLVVAKTVEGEIGIMAGHEPVLAILAQGEVRITGVDGGKVLAIVSIGDIVKARLDELEEERDHLERYITG